MKKLRLSIFLMTGILMLSSCGAKPSKHYVYWLNDDGTLISKELVNSGDHPTHDTPTSKKTNRIGYHYEFMTWISQNGEIYTDDYLVTNEDIIFTSFYKETVNTYTVTWQDEDGSIIDTTSVEYNKSPSHSDTQKDTDEENKKEYFFDGWYLNTEKINLNEYRVTQDITLNAKYNTYNLGGCEYGKDEGSETYHVNCIKANYPLRKIIILDEYNGLPVTGIGESTLDRLGSSECWEFVIGDNIEYIGKGAFLADEIRSITFGENSKLKTIGDSAFFAVKQLFTFKAPKTLEKIEGLAFANSTVMWIDLSEVDHVVSIGDRAFLGCTGLNRIIVKNDLLEQYKTKYSNLADYFIGAN